MDINSYHIGQGNTVDYKYFVKMFIVYNAIKIRHHQLSRSNNQELVYNYYYLLIVIVFY